MAGSGRRRRTRLRAIPTASTVSSSAPLPRTALYGASSFPRLKCAAPNGFISRSQLLVNMPSLSRVRSIFADVFQVPLEQVQPESSPDTIPNWDSLQHLNLVL